MNTQHVLSIDVLSFLRDNPNVFFKGRKLCDLFGFSKSGDRRSLRLYFESCRLRGEPVVASDKGYAFATDHRLISDYKRMLISKVRGLNREIELLSLLEVRNFAN